ncbi:hypothetical protein Skr01_37420 [Sphaerisporangium krabiense]|uniref:Uncharacterized protein n=1 Tax=Sphaerisporangium krabiense TaxID=763782 RepID=A0A7W9DPU9_9ACTN|nr:hypothetical protein [Sphaerisporangium krabiense]MBB5626738.1 hypothetical protein [Sphaerisporangium krabiense]GII63657.1 hypothetical protein Skr01_37420 [Sphaerisporangium krabiense]
MSHRADHPLVYLTGAVTRLMATVIVLGLAGAVAASPAEAASPTITVSDDHGRGSYNRISRVGNGRYISAILETSSPNYNIGTQSLSIELQHGNSAIGIANCKRRHRVCNIKIRQNVPHIRKNTTGG